MPKICMVSLGCAKNLVDAEIMLGETLGREFELELEPAAADVIIVNTCGFIEEAREEARATLREFLDVKRRSRRPIKVAAVGCWAERSPEELLREFPDLDAVWGLAVPSSLCERILGLVGGAPEIACLGKPAVPREGTRLLATPPSFAYLRLSDGCDNRCRYCAIPLIRGGLRSRRPDAILEEAKILEDRGVRELVLIGQDVTAYGKDSGDPAITLAALLEQLLATVRLPRIRLLYAHPAHLDDRVLALLASERRLCRYLDLPIQHISDRILERMGRGYGGARVRELLDRLAVGGVTVRSTLLLGFPGEDEKDFQEVLDLVGEGRFQHLGAFAYSPERDTPAMELDGAVPAEEAARRRDAVLAAQRPAAFFWLDSRVGGVEPVLIDSLSEPGWTVGRGMGEAPDADGVVYVRGGGSAPGDIIDACIIGREGYDLIAEPAGEGKRRRRRGR